MPSVKFIAPNGVVLNIVFTSMGYAFHYGGGDPNVHEEPDTLIFHLPWEEIKYYYYGISHINDLGILGLINPSGY